MKDQDIINSLGRDLSIERLLEMDGVGEARAKRIIEKLNTTKKVNKPMKNEMKVKALMVSELGYQLAKAHLGKKQEPSLADLRLGIMDSIKGFNYEFGKAEPNPDGTIEWPSGKRGIVGGYFDILANRVDTALDFMDEIKPEVLKAVAFSVYQERETHGKNVADMSSPEKGEVLPESIINWMANKLVFNAGRMFTIARASGHRENIRSTSTLHFVHLMQYLDKDYGLKIIEKTGEADCEDIDHGEYGDPSDSIDAWNIQKNIVKDTNIIDLPLVELSIAQPRWEAAKACLKWMQTVEGWEEVLKEEIDSSRTRAEKFAAEMKENTPSAKFKGRRTA